MSLVAELKRRSVFKIGSAYLVVGWLVVQAASIAFPAFDAPAWAMRVFILVVALGFPLALVLAWVFDVTPGGVKRDAIGVGSKRFFAAVALLAALAIGWFVRGGVGGGGHEAFEAPLGAKSTAVLPFVNMSSDKENEYFSDGLTETLLHKLAQVADLKVAARTSSFAFKGKQQDIRAIGRELGVATVMEGSVQRAGDTLRITAQLVRSADGSHIWSRNYDRKAADLFAIQDEIAGAVTEALVGALAPEAKAAIAKGGTQDMQAYDLYTKALQQLAIDSFASLTEAETLMQAALARDPGYVDALLGLANTWSRMSGTGMFGGPELERRIAPVLDRVEALDPGNGMLLGYRAEQARRRGDGKAARALFASALAAQPSNAVLLLMDCIDLRRHERDSAASLASIERAIALDPLNAEYHYQRAFSLMNLKRVDEAEQSARRAIEIDPRVSTSYTVMGDVALARGDLAGKAVWNLKANRADPRDNEFTAELGRLLEDLGEHAASDAWIAESRRLAPGNLFAAAAQVMVLSARGEHAKAVEAALPLTARHAEERAGNWLNAVASACASAQATGRLPEFRQALVQARAIPAEFTVDAFRAIETPAVSLNHQIGHITRMSQCLFAPGAEGAAARAQLQAVVSAARGADWASQPNNAALAALLRDDREALVTAFLAGELPAAGKDRALRDFAWVKTIAAFRGIDKDPRFARRLAEAERALAEQHAGLAQRLAAEGLTLLPAKAAGVN